MTPRQSIFVAAYLVSLNASEAARKAGYAAKSADREGYRLLRNVEVSEAVQAAMRARREGFDLSESWILARLKAVVERSMEPKPILDRDGRPTGQYRFDSAGANRALELLGRHLGMFTDKLKVSGLAELSDDELDRRIEAALAARRDQQKRL